MSTLKVNAISDAAGANGNAITLATDGTCTAKITNNLSNRNLIINGSAIINQRGDSTGITGTHGFYGPDRWKTCITNYGTWSITQATDGPDGFSKSYKLDCTTADASPAASDVVYLEYEIEAQDLQCLSYGTSGAKDTVLSFWVKSNLTSSTWNFSLQQRDNSGKQIQAAYTTHGTTNTWKKITIPIPKDTAGVIDDNNAAGLLFTWYLGGGSDYTGTAIQTSWASDGGDDNRLNGATNMLGASTSNYIQFTGLQFEIDSTGSGVATDFEHRSYADEFQKCLRYYFEVGNGTGTWMYLNPLGHDNNTIEIMPVFPVPMRAAPTVTATGTINCRACANGNSGATVTLGGSSFNAPGNTVVTGHTWWDAPSGTPFSGGYFGRIYGGTSTSSINFDAEI